MEPIHKFNGGRGATLCNECKKIITEGMTDDLYCDEHGGKTKFKYELVRKNDNKIIKGNDVKWIVWNDNGTFKEESPTIQVGASLVVDFFLGSYTWLTSPITKILVNSEKVINFETNNSIYSLIKN